MKKFLTLLVLALILGTLFLACGDPEKPAGSGGIRMQSYSGSTGQDK
jgi:hypothetical protein